MVTVFVEILKSSVLLYLGFLNIRRYVLYLYIETLKQRLDAINQLRVDRALAAMGPAFQQVYSLLPTLLHYHHPLMPGYLDGNVPRGICLYTPDETQRHYLEELELHRGMQTQEPPKGELPITGVYSMGSTSSVGQSCSSDLDIDLIYAKFADEFEKQYVSQGFQADRDIEETLSIGWKLLSILPRSELKRIDDKFLDQYYGK